MTNRASNSIYRQNIESWRSSRISKLKSPDGWLSLVGLFWLNDGNNSIGSDTSHTIVFPEETPAFFGTCVLNEGSVIFTPNVEEPIYLNGILPSNPKKLQTDTSKDPTLVTWNSYSWHLISRGGKIGIRLKNTRNPNIRELRSIPHFPINPGWKVPATFIPVHAEKTISVKNILGMQLDLEILGHLSWEYEGELYKVAAFPADKDTYLVIIGDQTNGVETYGGGRYLYINKPAPGKPLYIDFNKAENPPCAFTDFATCLLPPPENMLPFLVKAGEKMYHSNENR